MKKAWRPDNYYWDSKNGTRVYLHGMDTGHIKNILNCLQGKGNSDIPNPWCFKSHREWKEVFTQELKYRGEDVSSTVDTYEIF